MVGIEVSIGNVEELLVETNAKLGNIEKLLEFLLTPPDLVKYMKLKNKTISEN
jgi:hypothetical protein